MAVPYLQVVTQRHKTDCGVACLAMLLHKSYEETVMAFHEDVLTEGSTNSQLIRAAKRMDRVLQWSRKINLETDTGILMVSGWFSQAAKKRAKRVNHLVVLKEGLIIDTDATLWDVDVYVAAFQVKVLSLLIEKGD